MGTPAPPPPPPPPPNNLGVKLLVEKALLLPDDEVTKACMRRQSNIKLSQADHPSDLIQFWYSWFIPTKSIIQNGPVCGLVALAIAAEAILKTTLQVENLLEEAKIKGWTSRGEMFSAQNLASLAEFTSPCFATVQPISSVKALLEHIAQGYIALVPYDADCNHEPSQRQGHSAHWAVVSGFCFLFDHALPLPLMGEQSLLGLHHIRNVQTALNILDYLSSVGDIFVWTRHGKSRNLGLWSMSALIQSNLNLRELADRHKDSAFVIPEGGMNQNLAGQVIFLSPKMHLP